MASLTRGVVKAVGVLSGVQAVTVVSSVVRIKIIALWLGAAGIGLFGIFQTALDFLVLIAQMGLGTSATREIAIQPDDSLRARAVSVIKAWGWRLALLGLLLTLLVSPWLSLWSFDSVSHSGLFMMLSLAVCCAVLLGTVTAVLQGLRSFTAMARGTVIGSVGGLIVCIPLYYYLGESSIVPSLIAFNLVTLLGMIWASRHDKELSALRSVLPVISRDEIITAGKRLLTLGWWITVAYAAGTLSTYAFLSYLNREADIASVGFYQAGYTLLVRYSSFVFGALGTEYYPRISSVQRSPKRLSILASHEISLLTGAFISIVTGFIAVAPLIIKILYTSGFEVILPYIYLGAPGSVFRAGAVALSFIILAKGDGPRYVITECLSAAVFLIASILCYNKFGLAGMGVAYLAWFAYDMLQAWFVTRSRYGIKLSQHTLRLFFMAIALTLGCSVVAIFIPDYWIGNIISGIVAVVAAIVFFKKLKTKL